MPDLAVEIEIAAPPERVWAVLVDFAAYDHWHPLETIQGEAKRFGVIHVLSRKPGSNEVASRARARILRMDPGVALEFVNGRPFIWLERRWFHLRPHPKGTLLRHGIAVSGIRVKELLADPQKFERLRPHYEAVGQALSRRATSPQSPKTATGNRHSRRATKVKTHHKP